MVGTHRHAVCGCPRWTAPVLRRWCVQSCTLVNTLSSCVCTPPLCTHSAFCYALLENGLITSCDGTVTLMCGSLSSSAMAGGLDANDGGSGYGDFEGISLRRYQCFHGARPLLCHFALCCGRHRLCRIRRVMAQAGVGVGQRAPPQP